jgi:hypothetical protein
LDATKKAVLRALKLFCLGLVLQGMTKAAMFLQLTKGTLVEMKMRFDAFLLLHYAGGFFHGVRSLTFGVDLQEIRLMGILQVYGMHRFVMSYVFVH